MYRVFCESYKNFLESFREENFRLRMAKPFELIVDIKKYNSTKIEELEEQTKLVNSFLKLAYWY